MSRLGTRRWQAYRKAMLPILGDTCSLCGEPVDKTLSGNHRDGPTIDHTTPRSRGGLVFDNTNVTLAHKRCNSKRRNDPIQRPTSRDW